MSGPKEYPNLYGVTNNIASINTLLVPRLELESLRAERDALHASLSNILASVRAYLPPDGMTKDELIGRVIEQVDPWPAGAPLPRESREAK